MDYGIIFDRQQDKLSVVGYGDSNYVGDLKNKRSTTDYVYALARGPLCWRCALQSLVALSTTQAEYMAIAEATKQALWLVALVKNLGLILAIYSCFIRIFCR